MRIGPLGLWELLIVLALVLLVFGPTRLPAMARGIGQAIREFRRGVRADADVDGAGRDDGSERVHAAAPQDVKG